jgi:hypothetical protein
MVACACGIAPDHLQTAAKFGALAFQPLDLRHGGGLVVEVALFEFEDLLMGSLNRWTSYPPISRARLRADACFGALGFRAPVHLFVPIDRSSSATS